MPNLNWYHAEACRFDSFCGWLRATQHCAYNKWLPTCRWLQSTINLQSYSNLQFQNWTESSCNMQPQNWTESWEEFQKKIFNSNSNMLSKNDNIQIHQYIEMSQYLNPSACSSLVIFMYGACENHTFNAMPKLQQHPLNFAMNRTYYTFFLWRLYLVPGTTCTFTTTLTERLQHLQQACARLLKWLRVKETSKMQTEKTYSRYK